MAKVWFVRRDGGRWVAPGGQPRYRLPLTELVFRLDLGPQRWLPDDQPDPRPDLPPEEPSALEKVMVETEASDLTGAEFTWFRIGFYDSPYSPAEVVRRLDALQRRSA
jgi:hypothetical protein